MSEIDKIKRNLKNYGGSEFKHDNYFLSGEPKHARANPESDRKEIKEGVQDYNNNKKGVDMESRDTELLENLSNSAERIEDLITPKISKIDGIEKEQIIISNRLDNLENKLHNIETDFKSFISEFRGEMKEIKEKIPSEDKIRMIIKSEIDGLPDINQIKVVVADEIKQLPKTSDIKSLISDERKTTINWVLGIPAGLVVIFLGAVYFMMSNIVEDKIELALKNNTIYNSKINTSSQNGQPSVSNNPPPQAVQTAPVVPQAKPQPLPLAPQSGNTSNP